MIKSAFEVYRARDQAELVQHFHDYLLRNDGRPAHVVDTAPPLAYVSDNRWVIDCPHCGSGAGVSPRRPDLPAMCFECGQIRTVAFPPDWEDAERVLLERPWRHRHWFPLKETTDDLRGENASAGVPVPPKPQRKAA